LIRLFGPARAFHPCKKCKNRLNNPHCAAGTPIHPLLLSFVHMTIEVSSFDNGLSNDLGAVKSGKDFAPPAGIARGDEGVRTPNINFLRYSVPIAFLALTVGIGILAAPSKGHAENGTVANQDASEGA